MPPWAATVCERVGYLGHTGDGQPGFREAKGGTQAGAARAHHHHVVAVLDEVVLVHAPGPRASLSTENIPAVQATTNAKEIRSRSVKCVPRPCT